MGPIGVQEMVVIFLVALVLFGPKKLPELGKNIAKAMGEFKRAQSELKATFDREMQSIERETASARDAIHKTTAELASYSDELSASVQQSYHQDTAHPAVTNSSHLLESGAPEYDMYGNPTVSASEVPSAESHAESHIEASTTVVVAADGTVARGSTPPVQVAVAESNPLPEFGHTPAQAGKPETGSELPSLV